jgi:pimeloyl-ACP methyl ester carboxylesterase
MDSGVGYTVLDWQLVQGGTNMQVYASQYPDKVAGMVLVDSALEDEEAVTITYRGILQGGLGAEPGSRNGPDLLFGIVSQNHPARCSILPTRGKALLLQLVTSI